MKKQKHCLGEIFDTKEQQPVKIVPASFVPTKKQFSEDIRSIRHYDSWRHAYTNQSLLCTGTYAINGFPLRRFNQKFFIARRRKFVCGSVDVPKCGNVAYFKRQKMKKRILRQERGGIQIVG